MSDSYDDLLAPLARLMVARKVPFADLSERLKGHFVDQAKHLTDQKQTDSLLSLMTGLSRREVARLQSFERKPERPNHLARLVTLWRNDPEFSLDGHAKDLPRSGESKSFESLARRVLQDVHPRSLLLMLEQAGTVEVTKDMVSLLQSAYLPKSGSADQVAYLGANVGDHLSAATDNVLGQSPPHFERAMHFGGLTDIQVAELQDLFSSQHMAILEDLAQKAIRMKQDNASEGSYRIRLGGYGFSKSESKE